MGQVIDLAERIRPEHIRPVSGDYRRLDISRAFTWDEGILNTGPDGLYVVAFRSLRNLLSPPDRIATLLDLDHAAFEEAQTMPGFGMYHHDDSLSPEGEGLSFCMWAAIEHAKHAANQPRHREAVKYVRSDAGKVVYARYDVSAYQVNTSPEGVIFDRRAA